MSQPNVILVMTDQQKRDSLSVYGNPVCQTPNLERLASEGTIFDYAFTPYPVCVPSRVMTFTGRYSHNTRSRANSVLMQPDQKHLIKLMADAGYTTALSGKNHCFQPKDLGRFDYVWECGHGGPAEPPDKAAADAKQFIVESQINKQCWGTVTNPNPADSLGTALTVTHAIDFLETQPANNPFFLWCSIADPHTPLQTSEPYASMYDPGDVPIPDQAEDEMASKPMAQKLDHTVLCGDKVKEEDIRRVTATYYGMNTHIDHEIGRLLACVNQLGLTENTMVIYVSDHGEYLGEHHMIRKSKALYDCLTRIPMIIRWPNKIPASTRRDEFVEIIDLMPTILEAIGLDHPNGQQGRSILPLFEDDSSYIPRDAVFGEHGIESSDGSLRIHDFDDLGDIPTTPTSPDFAPRQKKGDLGPIKSIRTREWKLVYYPGNKEGELYDLTKDSGELRNLWGQPSQSHRKAELTARLLDWCIATEDRRPPIQAGGF
jgi:arylsulfatase A-like enzyme